MSPERKRAVAVAAVFLCSLVAYGAIAWWTYRFPIISYDEAAYSATARRLATEGGWLRLYGSGDLFFFPPLFNYLAGGLIMLGIERLAAVRFVAVLAGAGVNAFFFALVRRHVGDRAAWIAVLWAFFMPIKASYSAVGQVELPMLCAVLAACYVAFSDIEERWRAAGTAVLLAAGVWIKETAIGFIPLFVVVWFIRGDRRLAVRVGVLSLLLLSPLFAQSFFPHEYDLFYEVTTPFIRFSGLQPDMMLMNLLRQFAVDPLRLFGFGWAIAAAFVVLTVFSFAHLRRRSVWADPFLAFSVLGVILWGSFFLYFPRKFDYYLIPLSMLLLVPVSCFLAKRTVLAKVATGTMIALSLWALWGFVSFRDETAALRDILARAADEMPGARVAMTLPRS
ncbi:MAG TPA: glycosyltransferase family 39 protein, partial [bacterium]|nr:glycosyltransferase family 39 protein [bacterium]